jgi:hypothetical protein
VSSIHQTPITVIQNGTAYYHEGGEDPVRHEGTIEIYNHWIRPAGPTGNWIPRGQVEQIHEF